MMSPKESPGLNKLVEEMGEVLQLCGKIGAYPGGDHPDGAGQLYDRIASELGDLMAAIDFFAGHNLTRPQLDRMRARAEIKSARFNAWHQDPECLLEEG